MRPRPEGRGEPGPWHDRGDRSMLQCGHGPKAVENTRRWPICGACSELQCGHGPKAVENPTGVAERLADGSCFNAATARRPWRTR